MIGLGSDKNVVVVYLRGIETQRSILRLFLCSSWLSYNMSWLTLPYVPSRYRGTISLLWTCEMFLEILCVLCFLCGVLQYMCFVLVAVKKHTTNNLYTKIRQLFLGSFKYFSPKYDVVTASYVFFCVIGSFRVPSCWHTLRFCPNHVMPLGHQKGRTFWWLTRILKTQSGKKDYFMYMYIWHVIWSMLFSNNGLLCHLPM